MSNQPHTISLNRLLDLVRGLGIEVEPADLKSVHMEAGRVELVRFRRNDAGQKYAVGPNELATETVTIAIEVRA